MTKRTKEDWTAEDLARQAEAANALIEYLRNADEDDDDLIEDSIEGETEFKEVIDRALEQIAEAEMMAKAIKEREQTLAQRCARFEGKAGFLRNCITMAMAQANGDRDLPFTLNTPAATVTLREGKPKVLITDEAALPAQFWRTPEPVVDKKKLNEYIAALDDADPVVDDDTGDTLRIPDGVELSDAGFSLAIRRK